MPGQKIEVRKCIYSCTKNVLFCRYQNYVSKFLKYTYKQEACTNEIKLRKEGSISDMHISITLQHNDHEYIMNMQYDTSR